MTARAASLMAAMGLLILAGAAAQGRQTAPPAQARLVAFDARIRPLLASMTLDEKIGQMTQPDQEFLKDPSDVATLFIGSVLSGGNSDPVTNTIEHWTAMYEALQAQALKTRLRIPLLYGVDAVHGHNNVIGTVIFPHNIGLGATRNPTLVEEVARLTAKEVRATGINWAFAPCVAVPRDERWGRTYEGFGEDPQLVAELGEAAVRGLQGDLGSPVSVAACAKHFVGDGGTTFGTGMPNSDQPGGRFPLDQGDMTIPEAEVRRIHLAPYINAIRAGVVTIMPSYSSWNGEKMSGSRYWLTDVLKQELGFEGFLISDYNALDQLPGDRAGQIERSINAGMDMVMVPQAYREFITTLKGLVESGRVPVARIDDAVTRILRVKFAMGLMEQGWSPKADPALLESVGSAAHRAVARRAVRESLVLLKNERGTLPFRPGLKRIHVAGAAADDLGVQCGGWTIQWQGARGPLTVGTTLRAAIEQSARRGTAVTYSADGSGAAGADVAVVVIGEPPSAEFFGDRRDLDLPAADVELVTRVKATGVPVVVVLLSGRPLIVNGVLSQADAFVAAWLPGTEGLGVADVLFGDYAPTGKLPMSWPKSNAQLPINVGDASYDPLFPYGFGLTY
ncbi:MAG TPA: glycoside hydrolase family 3 N-terminal domain-containing protein [Vicinamibacterales bacterium]